MVTLDATELAARARQIALVVSDNDGVLTDGTVLVSDVGEELKAYSLRDGMGVERLRRHDIRTAICTRENTPIVRRRAEKLELPHVWQGVRDKRAHLPRILADARVDLHQLVYIGDDVNDLGIIQAIGAVGLTAAPADAMPEVRRAVHFVTTAPGGRGAFRDVAEWLLALRADTPTKETAHD